MRTLRKLTRRTGITLLVIAAVLVVARLALNPFVKHHTQEVLDSLQGYRGSFKDVSVSLYRLSYTIDGLKLVQVPAPRGGENKRPFFFAQRIQRHSPYLRQRSPTSPCKAQRANILYLAGIYQLLAETRLHRNPLATFGTAA